MTETDFILKGIGICLTRAEYEYIQAKKRVKQGLQCNVSKELEARDFWWNWYRSVKSGEK
jgi:hypothetical protein